MSTRLSTIIPVYGEHALAVAHAAACQASTRKPDEVIVVNDGGEPDLRDMLLAEPKALPVIYARIEQDIPWNYTGARNLGTWISTGDILAHEDLDHVPTANLYEEALAILAADPECYCVRPKRRMVQFADLTTALGPSGVGEFHEIAPGSFTRIVRRWVFIQMKGCNEDLAGGHGGETEEMNRRMKAYGHEKKCPTANYLRIEDGFTKNLSRKHRCGQNRATIRDMRGRRQQDSAILRFTYTVEALRA